MAERVGVIGAGRMGLPIIGHLVRAGFEVFVSDRDQSKRQAVEQRGAHFVEGALEVVQNASTILIAVGYDREVRELLLEPTELSQRASSGTIFAVLSTVSPYTVQFLAESSQKYGVHVVDSPVCRGGRAADQGTLLSFVAGDDEEIERLRSVLKAYSSDVVPTGPVGTAQVAKAVNNMILWATLVADHEGLALAQRFGVNIQALRSALLMSSATNGALENWGNQTMAWAEDDMAIIGEMASQIGIALPQAGVTREICRALKPRRYRLKEYGK